MNGQKKGITTISIYINMAHWAHAAKVRNSI